MYMSKQDVDEVIQKQDYSTIELSVSHNEYEYLRDEKKLFLLYCKFNLLSTKDWTFYDISNEMFHRLKKIYLECQHTKPKKQLKNLCLTIDYDMVLKSKSADSYYIFRGGLNSVFYTPTKTAKTLQITELSVNSIYTALREYENLDFNEILLQSCPDSKGVCIENILSVNVSALYTKEK